ncbi:hypothetical Protein YC6258_00137 [Gynuella sunshinyii YC6258]|uniref:Uncharacterized protein n=1 Tax=Gynuella sunshinyii YC6258 TaxID=1445510 RepID=A0A0C5VFP2_9GAMM|nr:hypothetical Protein YC6258_00137 [Gynuella sunshinyii YC6258]
MWWPGDYSLNQQTMAEFQLFDAFSLIKVAIMSVIWHNNSMATTSTAIE